MEASSLVALVPPSRRDPGELPWTVRQAALFRGISPQTVYLWVERRHIPHLRIMGRNIRFLRSDLDEFRASFKREAQPQSILGR